MSGKFYCPELRQLWHLKQCKRCRAKPTYSQVSCYSPRPYTFFFLRSWEGQVLSWCQPEQLWRGTDNLGPSVPPSRVFIPVNSITLDWFGQNKPLWASFLKISAVFFREEKNKHTVLKMTFTVEFYSPFLCLLFCFQCLVSPLTR